MRHITLAELDQYGLRFNSYSAYTVIIGIVDMSMSTGDMNCMIVEQYARSIRGE